MLAKRLWGLVLLVALASATSAGLTLAQVKYKESPMLTRLVEQGKLSPVDQRVPKDSLVVEPLERPGEFGGTLRYAHMWFIFAVEPGLVGRSEDRNSWVPQVAKSWEWGSDWKSITFRLREGMKWSDGTAYTADDIIFWWNDIVKSKYHTQPYSVAGMNPEVDRVVKVDNITVRFEFAQPRPKFLEESRGGWSYGFYGYPAHYFKRFHPDYNPRRDMRPEEQFRQLLDRVYQNKFIYDDPEAPTILAWRTVAYKQGEFQILERNPYYWKVDRAGNQLPYIDHVQSLQMPSSQKELIKLKALAGEVDFEMRSIGVKEFPLFKEKEKDLGADVILFKEVYGSPQGIIFNWNAKDEALRPIIRNTDFRRALSLALDRNLINEAAFQGIGKVGHGFSEPGVYNPEIDGAWAQYDPDRANRMLDSIGLNRRDSEGFRTLPNGGKLTLILMFQPGWGQGADQVAEILLRLGVRVEVLEVDY